MPDWVLLGAAMLATGCIAGVLAGLFGIGGGIVIVPMLEAVLGYLGVDPAIRMHVAVATSLATIIPTSISSARAHYRRGAVDLDIVRRWAAYVLIGALLGAWIASALDSRALAVVFATVSLFVAIRMVFFPGTKQLTQSVPRTPWIIPIPVSIGVISTMMGIGGGVLSVMTLRLFNEQIHRAVGTAALFGLVISLPGTVGFMVTGIGDARVPAGTLGYVSLLGFAFIAPATVLFAPLGARIAHAFSARQLSMAFGGFLIIASARLFYRALAPLAD